jgi:hypothetical protein
MQEKSNKYLCPFCVSSWDCDGPHIEEEDINSFNERAHYMREDMALLSKELIQEFAKANNLNLNSLSETIYTRLINRSY